MPNASKNNSQHAFTDEGKQRVKDEVLTWNPMLEDGFSCSHSIQKRYFREEGTEWKRVMRYDRWTQYVHFYHLAIGTELSNPNITDERRAELVA